MAADINIVLDLGVDLPHAVLIINNVRHEIPVSLDLFIPLGQLMELLQGLLTKVVPVQLQRHQRIVRLQALSYHS